MSRSAPKKLLPSERLPYHHNAQTRLTRRNALDVGQIRLYANGSFAKCAAKSRNVRRNSYALKNKNER